MTLPKLSFSVNPLSLPLSAKPCVILINGFASTYTDSLKHDYLQKKCPSLNLNYFSFDGFGHGSSEGTLKEGTITRWSTDLVSIIDTIAEISSQKIYLVGSSIGLWVSLSAASKRPNRISGIIGIGGSVNFTDRIIYQLINNSFWPPISLADLDKVFEESMYSTVLDETKEDAELKLKSPYNVNGFPFGKCLLEDARLTRFKKCGINVDCPVRLLHGTEDEVVPFADTEWIKASISHQDVQIKLIDKGDHRLSKPEDLEILGKTLEDRRKLIFGETHPSTLESLELLGEVLRMQGKYGDAEVVYSYAVRIRSGVYGRDHETTVSILSMLAEVLRMQGKYEQAEPLYVEVHLKVGSLEARSNVEEVRRMIRQNSQQNGDVKEDVEQKLKDQKDMLGIVNNVSSLLRSLPFSFKNG
ncbi:hypothetical protein HK098_008170 [Nowakowskiella sp. JEL0407]|nr:hypothetical protein HK098_008170 [Nowakowskiella sp. JEL0407]